MKFEIELLESDPLCGGQPHSEVVEIFNTEENELTLRGSGGDSVMVKSALHIGMDELFLYGWLTNKDDVIKVRYKLKPV